MTLWVGLWHLHELHHLSGGDGGTPDPQSHAFAVGIVFIVLGSLAVLVVGGPLLLVFTRRIRDGFWVIPLANVIIYLCILLLRNYPGGFAAQFRFPGLTYTLCEVILLLVLSLVAATVLAVLRLLGRLIRHLSGSKRAEEK